MQVFSLRLVLLLVLTAVLYPLGKSAISSISTLFKSNPASVTNTVSDMSLTKVAIVGGHGEVCIPVDLYGRET